MPSPQKCPEPSVGTEKWYTYQKYIAAYSFLLKYAIIDNCTIAATVPGYQLSVNVNLWTICAASQVMCLAQYITTPAACMLSETSVLPPVFDLVMYNIINIDVKERFAIRNHGMDRFYLK